VSTRSIERYELVLIASIIIRDATSYSSMHTRHHGTSRKPHLASAETICRSTGHSIHSSTAMTDGKTKPTEPPPSAPEDSFSSAAATAVKYVPKWQLPNGVEKHIESGLLKSAVGAAAGLAVGVVFFRGGKGWRMASAAAGVGVAIGSTVERATAGKEPKSLFGPTGLW